MRTLLQVARSKYALLPALGLSAMLPFVEGCGAGARSVAGTGLPVTSLAVSAAPRLGYAWNASDKTLRPIEGVPGAAHFGESVTSAGTYELIEADPTGASAVLLDDSRGVYTMSLPGGTPILSPVKAAAGSKIVFSPQGSWAFVFLPGASDGTLLTHLSGTAQTRSVSFATSITDAVVSDAGSVAASVRASGSTLVRVTALAGTSSIPVLKNLGGMSFIAGTDDLLLADADANSLLRVRSASTNPVSSVLPTSGLLKAPAAVATSQTAHWAVVANGADASVVRVDLVGGTPALRTPCSCKPETVAPLAGDGAFRLTALQDGPMWVGDASKAAFPVLFIPALPGQIKGATP